MLFKGISDIVINLLICVKKALKDNQFSEKDEILCKYLGKLL